MTVQEEAMERLQEAAPGSTLFDADTVEALLTTTRAVRRRLDLDRLVPRQVIEECLELAVHAPSADNQQNWRWLVVTDPDKRKKIGELYRFAWGVHSAAIAGRRRRFSNERRGTGAVASGKWLAENLERVPVLVVPCVVGLPPTDAESAAIEEAWQKNFHTNVGPSPATKAPPRRGSAALTRNSTFYGSIYPAIWSFLLALRSRGLGSVITTMHLPFRDELAAELGIPNLVTQICLLPVAYTLGTDFRPAPREPAAKKTYWNGWEGTGP
jgi:nitroreductase